MHTKIERIVVWSGGAVFVASLAIAGWAFIGPFGRVAHPFDRRAAVVDTLLLSAFALHHSLFARSGVKNAFVRIVPQSLLRSSYVWIASLLFAAVFVWWEPIGGDVYRAPTFVAALLKLVQLVGLGLVVRAVRAISALELAGIVPPKPKADDLQIAGPYRLVRHPLYLGWVLLVGATSHMTGDRLIFALVTTAYIALAIPWEERGLVAEFGGQYERYRSAVRWRLIPGVY